MNPRLALLLVLASLAFSSPVVQAADVFERDNLVAWCVVPFDGKKRGPEERAALLAQLGFKHCAYDWRQEHVATFEEEILAYKKHGIEYFAFWSEHPEAFRLFKQYDLHPQIWRTAPSPKGDTQQERIAAAAAQLLPLVKTTAEMGSKLGLYNHGGWGGEPENLIEVCEYLRQVHGADHVGIVYNFHHGHEHIQDWPQVLGQLRPYLLCLNINGMNPGAQPKILQLGQGQHELEMLRTIRDSGYQGPIGIIGHTQDDVELRLRDNLDGLEWLRKQLRGEDPGPKPQPRT